MSNHSLIVSVSGIRGIVGDSLTPDVASGFARALGTWVEGRPVVLGRDSRPSGAMLSHAITAGLQSCGCTVFDLGIAPTPTVGVAIRQLGAAGGIQVSASHNPSPYNGLKLFGPGGNVMPPTDGAAVLKVYEGGAFRSMPWDQIGGMESAQAVARTHVLAVLKQVDVHAIRQHAYSILLDANHGAGGPLGARLLRDELGCRVTMLGAEPNGMFVHEPEPTEANVTSVCRHLRDAKPPYDAGFILDPDADRLAILDEKGTYVGEELTLALAAWFRLQQGRGPVVVNMSTSRVIEDIANRFKCPFHRSAVGEANVVAKMQAVKAVLGGEGNGGVIDPRVGWVRDPFVGMALVLNLMAQTGKSLSQLVAELPAYVIIKDKYEINRERLPGLYERLVKKWPDAEVNREDGMRLDWADRWVHVRPSNTEPIIRVIAEAPDGMGAKQLCGEVGKLLATS